MKDERIQTTQNRVAAGGYWILYLLITISLYYRMLILRQHPRECWDIFVIWVIGMFVIFISSANKGLYDDIKRGTLATGIGALSGMFVMFVMLFIMGNIHSVVDVVVYLFGFLLGIGPVIGIAYFLNRRWRRKEGLEDEKRKTKLLMPLNLLINADERS